MRLNRWLRGLAGENPSVARLTEAREREELYRLRAERRRLNAETRLINVRTVERVALLCVFVLAAILSLLGTVSIVSGLTTVGLSGFLSARLRL